MYRDGDRRTATGTRGQGQVQKKNDSEMDRNALLVRWTWTGVRDCDRQTGNGDTDRATYVLPSLVLLLSQIWKKRFL